MDNAVEYVDETGLLFRSYRKGGGSATDGLQVYRDGVLVGDVDVPLGFRMAGYVAPYYYSYVVPDEEGERLYMFRFKWLSHRKNKFRALVGAFRSSLFT